MTKIKLITVEKALSLIDKETLFVDTRSQKEFAEDHIPNAINIPLFSNEERAIIGTLYKQDQVKAYKEGFSIYNTKIIDFLKKFSGIDKDKKIIIYCWRGGMRSKTITELVATTGKETYQLEGGYKEFRKYIRNELQKKPPFKLIVLQGLAGCGKTDLIKNLNPSIDLEGFAQHRSSLFGAIGLKPVSQKLFETKLWYKMQQLKDEHIVFIEGESKKIGNLFVPDSLFSLMEQSLTVHILASMEERSKRIIRDYFSYGEDKEIKRIIEKLKVYLSKKRTEELCLLVDEKKYELLAQALLEEHYDQKYQHALEQQEYIKEISNDNLDEAVKELIQLREELNS